jgi:hypothetical protein
MIRNRCSLWVVWAMALVATAVVPRVALPAGAASKGTPVEIAGKVVHGTKASKRRLYVQSGAVEVAVHVPSNTWIERKGKKISVHEVKAGSYIRATGKRIGNTRVEAYHIWVIGDRHDFLTSPYGKPGGEKGYIHRM